MRSLVAIAKTRSVAGRYRWRPGCGRAPQLRWVTASSEEDPDLYVWEMVFFRCLGKGTIPEGFVPDSKQWLRRIKKRGYGNPLQTSTTYPKNHKQQAQAKAWRENEFGAAAARSSPLDWRDQKKRPATRRRKGIIGCQTKWTLGGKKKPRNKEVTASGKKMRRSANGKFLVTRAADVRVDYLKVKSTARTRKMRTNAQLNRYKAQLQKAESELNNMKKLAKTKIKMQMMSKRKSLQKMKKELMQLVKNHFQLVKKKAIQKTKHKKGPDAAREEEAHIEEGTAEDEEEESPDAAREEECQEGPDEEEAYFCMLCSNAGLTDGVADKTTKQTCIDVHQGVNIHMHEHLVMLIMFVTTIYKQMYPHVLNASFLLSLQTRCRNVHCCKTQA